MSENAIHALVTMTEAPEPARLSPAPSLNMGFGHERRPHDPPPLDWPHAVAAAAARLDEGWVRPDMTGYMVASGLAGELAATLSAYGMTAAESVHMHSRLDEVLEADATRVLDDGVASGTTPASGVPR
jgi:hypothetical protein